MFFSRFKTRKKVLRFLLLGIFLLLIGLGNFYVGQIKINEHQKIVQATEQTISEQGDNKYKNRNNKLPNDSSYQNLLKSESALKKSINRVNYYKLVSIGGLIFILLGLMLIFTGLLLRFRKQKVTQF